MTPGRRRVFRIPFRKDRFRDEAEEEIRFHLAERAATYEREGMSPEAAREAAFRRFGDPRRVSEDVEELMRRRARAMKTSTLIDNLRSDLAYAGRQLLRYRGFSAVAILTITLAIGGTTSVFSVVDGIMLRPLPYEDPDELVMIWADYTRKDVVLPDLRREWLSWPNFADFRDEIGAIEAAAAFGGWNPTLTGSGDAEQLNGGAFSHGMFSDVLAVTPAIGRNFLPEEDQPDGPAVALLGHGFWQRAFGGDPGVVGSTIRLNDQPYEVLGVMPEDFRAPAFLGTDVWTPLQFDPAQGGRGGAYLRAVGRLADGATLELAEQQADQLGARLEREYPEANRDIGFNLYPLQYDLVQGTRTALWVLLGAVALVLLVACVNVANLLLARGASRHGELAVRAALGAGGGRILRQLMTESMMLAGIGGLLGLALAFVGTDFLVSLAPPGIPLIDQVSVDGRILAFAALVTVVVGLIFGALPALRATKANPASTLRQGGRGGNSARQGRLRNSLVVAQIAMALMLLMGAGLLVRSFQNLRSVDLGFEPAGALTIQTQLPFARYPDAARRHGFFRPLEERLAALPGVQAVGSVNALPMAGVDGDNDFFIEGAPPPEPGESQVVWLRRATPGYFDAMSMDVIAGRAFEPRDTDEQPQVIIVNETLASRYFDGDALGRRINVNNPDSPVWREIVGVVADVKNFGVRAGSRNAMYVPFYQISTGFMFTVVRASVDPVSLMSAVRREVSELDPGVAVAQLQPMSAWVDASLSQDKFTATLLTGFALTALLLAVVGLYGVVSYSVNMRIREMGVRIALGAEDGAIRTLVLRWSLALAGAGILLGALAAVGLTRLLEGLLFGVGTTDGATFTLASLSMAVAAVAASLVPAVRATRVDPIKVLKSE